MKCYTWGFLGALALVAGCGIKNDQTVNPETGHGTTLSKQETNFRWGGPAPEAPLTPSPVPQLPEQTNSPMNPGDGPKAEDKLIPSTANPASPK